MEDEIDLRRIFDVLWRNRILIIGIFMIAVLIGGAISFFMPSIYRVSSIVALGTLSEGMYMSQASATEIMLSDEFLLDVMKELNLNMIPNKFRELKESIKIGAVKDTDNLIMISFESGNRQEGMEIVEGMVRLFANHSEEGYNTRMKILADELAIAEENLNVAEKDINQSREVFKSIEESADASSVESELRISRMIDYLQGQEARRSDLLKSYVNLKKDLTLSRNLKVVQEPRAPLSPIRSNKALLVTVSGLIGLMIGIFAAFLCEGRRRPAE